MDQFKKRVRNKEIETVSINFTNRKYSTDTSIRRRMLTATFKDKEGVTGTLSPMFETDLEN